MIRLDYLERLMTTARRPSEGKPLDAHKGIGPIARGNNMRHTRLFRVGDGYEVRLHRHTIARINAHPEGVLIELDSVDEWPTNTTAARLEGVLQWGVYRRQNKLRFHGFTNVKTTMGAPPPLTNKLRVLQSSLTGKLTCLNPELMVDYSNPYVGDKATALDIRRWVSKLKKYMTLQVKLGVLDWSQADLECRDLKKLYGQEIDEAVMTQAFGWFGHHKGSWNVSRWAARNVPMNAAEVNNMALSVRKALYKANGVIHRDVITFTSQEKS